MPDATWPDFLELFNVYSKFFLELVYENFEVSWSLYFFIFLFVDIVQDNYSCEIAEQ